MTTPDQILIYDGDCAICTTCVRWIERRWNSSPRPRAIAYQRLHEEAPELVTPSVIQMEQSVWWLDGHRRDSGARAVARTLLATSGIWRVIGAALLTPPLSWGAQRGYQVVASNRHRLPGYRSACDAAKAVSSASK